VSPDGKWVLAGCEDRKARLWDVTADKLVRMLEHDAAVSAAAFSPDSRTCAAGTQDFRVQRWEVASGKRPGSALPATGASSTLGLSRDDRWLLAGTQGNVSARLGDLTTNQLVGPLLPHRDELSALAISPDTRYLLTASHDGTARLWDAVTG